MKLLDNFKQQLGAMGRLKRVWLTTFNLDIAFVETWVLPAVLGMDPPVSRMDYEVLQRTLTASGIDFRIYCDPRMVAKDKPKRTSVEVWPVSIRQLAQGDAPHADYLDPQRSLFHPKVFYLEDDEKKIVIGAGSANLTLSGWGRNQEAVDFRCLATNEQYQQVKQFFINIDTTLDDDEFFPVRRKFIGQDSDWSFIHSLDGQTLLEALEKGEALKTLSVCSPYLADDMAGFIASLLEPEQQLELVPDRVAGRFIRTRWQPELQTLLDEGRLTLCHPLVPRDERALMTHAKLWLGQTNKSKRLAVGSWNFTPSGCASLDDKGWNVEAGIVHSVARSTTVCGPVWSEVKDSDFASDELLEEEALNVAELPLCDLSVIFDWRRSEYQLYGNLSNRKVKANYALILPGISGSCELVWKQNGELKSPLTLPLRKSDVLLNNPFFTLRTAGKSDWQGMIIETNAEDRRALSFASLDDLLNSYLLGDDPDNSDRLMLRGSAAQDQTQGEGDIPPERQFEPTSYFRLFQAMECRRDLLNAEEDLDQLYRHLFSAPGSLLELAEFSARRASASPQPVFDWFLAQEVNALAALGKKRFNRLRRDRGDAMPVPAHLWQSLRVVVPQLSGDAASADYLSTIREACQYGE
ncbi:hypothetical protein [Phytobacter sp. V91]|uniref:hypothetical protein n=1 Tax=Phytobacter sp. V91 TaxID=3369425 RepID=UPI003F5F94A1